MSEIIQPNHVAVANIATAFAETPAAIPAGPNQLAAVGGYNKVEAAAVRIAAELASREQRSTHDEAIARRAANLALLTLEACAQIGRRAVAETNGR